MEYFAPTVIKLLDINQNYFTQSVDRGFLKPTHIAGGSGGRHSFNEEDLCRALLFKRLNDAGFSKREASRIAFMPLEQVDQDMTIEMLFHSMVELDVYEAESENHPNILTGPRKPFLYAGYIRTKDGKISSRYFTDKQHFSSLYANTFNAEIIILINLVAIVEHVRDTLKSS